MDLGYFIRRPWILWSWLLLPALLILFVLSVSHFYCLALEKDRAGILAHYRVIPEMELSLRQADQALARFDADAEITFDQLGVMFNESAVGTEWEVVSVRIDEAAPSPREGLDAFRVTVIGEGPMQAAMRYLDKVQDLRRLIEVEVTNLNVKQGGYDPRYSGRFVFVYYLLEPAA